MKNKYSFPIYTDGGNSWFRSSEMPADEKDPFLQWMLDNAMTDHIYLLALPEIKDGYYLKAYDYWKSGGKVVVV